MLANPLVFATVSCTSAVKVIVAGANMAITIQLPTEIEQDLRHQDPQLDYHVRDQFLVANYQAGNGQFRVTGNPFDTPTNPS